MSIGRLKIKNKFTITPNEITTDMRVTHGAFRLYCYLRSLPDEWKINNTHLKKVLNIGQDQTIANYWKNLTETGWIKRTYLRNESGTFIGDWDLEILDGIPHSMDDPEIGIDHSMGDPYYGATHSLINTNLNNNTKKTSSNDDNIGLFSPEEITPEKPATNNKIKVRLVQISDFDRFWKLYPKKDMKGQSYKCFEAMCRRKDKPSYKEIILAVKNQKETSRWKEGFIPLATTWLNQHRWKDDPALMISWDKKTSSNSGIIKIPKEVKAVIDYSFGLLGRYNPINKDSIYCSMVKLYDFLNSLNNRKNEEFIPAAPVILKKYVEYLNDSLWLLQVGDSAFDKDSPIFYKFSTQYSKKVGFDIITGKEIY